MPMTAKAVVLVWFLFYLCCLLGYIAMHYVSTLRNTDSLWCYIYQFNKTSVREELA